MKPSQYPKGPLEIMVQAQRGRTPRFKRVDGEGWGDSLQHSYGRVSFIKNDNGWYVAQLTSGGPHVGLPIYDESDSFKKRWDDLFIDVFVKEDGTWKQILEDEQWNTLFGMPTS